jgi:hypothetical protein
MAKKKKNTEERLFPPAEILRTLKYEFPDVNLSAVEWSWEVPFKIWEADFELDKRHYEAEITVTGHLLLVEIEVPQKEVPEGVLKAVKAQFEGATIESVSHILYGNDDVHYEFSLKKGNTAFEVHYREDGQFVGKGKDL